MIIPLCKTFERLIWPNGSDDVIIVGKSILLKQQIMNVHNVRVLREGAGNYRTQDKFRSQNGPVCTKF